MDTQWVKNGWDMAFPFQGFLRISLAIVKAKLDRRVCSER